MKLTNTQVKQLQFSLKDIISTIDSHCGIINNQEISDVFLLPILQLAANTSDKIFLQTKDTMNEINL